MYYTLSILIVQLFSFYIPLPHPIHISKTSVFYDSETRDLQITSHIFIDDLEYGISGEKPSSLFLCTNKEIPNADSLIADYIRNNLQISVDGHKISLDVLGKERSDDYAGAWIYIKSKLDKEPTKILITNTILIKKYTDQKNILNFSTSDKSKSRVLLFDSKNTTEEVNL